MTAPQAVAEYSSVILRHLCEPTFLRVAFAGATRFAKIPVKHVTIRPVDLREGRRLQVSRSDGRKDLSTNHTVEELPAALADILAAGFANVHITTTTGEIDLRLTKKGDLLVGRKPREQAGRSEPAPAPHNRSKDVPLPEGRPDPLLQAMGILDRHNNVRPTMRDKFTQINQFLTLLSHVLPQVTQSLDHPITESSPLLILDCGCGSSLLTLAAAHFVHLQNIPARVVGIDRNPEVIAKSQARAAELPHLKLEFRQAPIGTIKDLPADIVLALHACDTATDDAIAQAVRSNAKLLLAVPCCHKFLNDRLKIPELAAVHHHGILHERLADIVTDTFRALLLEVMGYHAEVIEFISPEHTPRNLMLRAVRTRPPGNPQAVARYRDFLSFTRTAPYLATTLADLLPT